MKPSRREEALTPALSQGERERNGLPEGWELVVVSDACQLNPSKPSVDVLPAEAAVTFVPMPAVDAESGTIASPQQRPFAVVRKGYTAFRNGDVIMAKITPCMENGKAAIVRGLVNGLGFGSTEFHVLRPTPAVLADYVFYYVRQQSFREAAAAEMTGSVGQKRVPAEFLRDAEIPLPPLAEQRRIVAQVEALLARVNAARERLAEVPAILKRFRQAILAAACSGRLTEEWREQHPDTKTAPRTHTNPRSVRQKGRRGANLSREGELILDGMPELPLPWDYYRADEVAAPSTVITYGIVLPGPEISGGVPYVRQQDVLEDGTLNVAELRHTGQEIARKHNRSSLMAGDVLLCIIRNLRVATVPKGIDGANITQGMVRIRPATSIATTYLAAYLACPHAQSWLKARYFGMDMPRVNVEDARAIPIALPPLAEQHEIVRRVDALFKLADAIERRVAAATRRSERLTQAILAKAFRGDLVPTEAELGRREGRDYEPASVLLERVRAERAAREPSPRPSPRGRGRKSSDGDCETGQPPRKQSNRPVRG